MAAIPENGDTEFEESARSGGEDSPEIPEGILKPGDWNDPLILLNISKSLTRGQQQPLAEKLIDRATELAPDNFDINLRKAEILRIKGEREEALALLDRLEMDFTTGSRTWTLLHRLKLFKAALGLRRFLKNFYNGKIWSFMERAHILKHLPGYSGIGSIWAERSHIYLADRRARKRALQSIDEALAIDERNTEWWIMKGTVLEMLRKQEPAIECYNEALKIDPKNEGALFRKGDIYYGRRMFVEAIDYYDQVIDINPRNEIVWNNKGFALFELRNRKQNAQQDAIRCYNAAIEINPGYNVAWYNKAYALHSLDVLDEASRSYDRALEINPRDEVAWNNKGNAIYNMGRLGHRPAYFEKSIPFFEKAIDVNPDYEIAWNNIGNALIYLNRYRESIPYHDKAIEINPEFYYPYHAKAEALHQMGKLHDALEEIDVAIDLNPRYAPSFYEKGRILSRLGRYDEARKYLNRSVLMDPGEGKFWLAYGKIFEKLDDPGLALKYYDEAIRCYDTRARNTGQMIPWADKGQTLEEVGFYKDAMEAYETALMVDPTGEYALICKAKLLSYFGDSHGALETIEECLKYNPDEDAPWHTRGVLLYSEERYTEAVECFDRAMSIRKTEPEYHYMKGCALLRSNNAARALEAFAEAQNIRKNTKNDFEIFYEKGLAHLELAQYDEALESMERAIEADDSGTGIMFSKAGVLEKLNRLNEASELYDEIIGLEPGNGPAWRARGDLLERQGKPDRARFYLNRAGELEKDFTGSGTKREDTGTGQENSLLEEPTDENPESPDTMAIDEPDNRLMK